MGRIYFISKQMGRNKKRSADLPTKRIRKPKVPFSPSSPPPRQKLGRKPTQREDIRPIHFIHATQITPTTQETHERDLQASDRTPPLTDEEYEGNLSCDQHDNEGGHPDSHISMFGTDHSDEDETPDSYSETCACGTLHTFQSLKNEMSVTPAPPKKDQEKGYHTCTKLWLELTHRISNKLFVCLASGRGSNEDQAIKFWCFRGKPQLHNVKRHYRSKHKDDPVTRQLFPEKNDISYSSDRFNKEILEWIVKRNHTFSLVEEPEFRSILANLNPNLRLLHRTQLVLKYLPILDSENTTKVLRLAS